MGTGDYTMLIVRHYKVYAVKTGQSGEKTYRIKNCEEPLCPKCGKRMMVSGSRRRKLKETDGSTCTFLIRRLYCKDCNRIHHELPDLMIPRKRYSAKAIRQVLSTNDMLSVNFAGECSTIYRLRKWAKGQEGEGIFLHDFHLR